MKRFTFSITIDRTLSERVRAGEDEIFTVFPELQIVAADWKDVVNRYNDHLCDRYPDWILTLLKTEEV